MNLILDAAQNYMRRGWYVIPVPFRKKGPVTKEWQKLRLEQEDLSRYFNGVSQNIGVLVGGPSAIYDGDMDCPEAVALAPYFLPETCTFGRKSAKRSHWIFHVPKESHRTITYALKRGEKILELRGTGGQTVFPPSVHPSGEKVEFHDCRDPVKISYAELKARFDRLAVATLFARAWPRVAGTRQACALALSGALLRSGLEDYEAVDFIEAVATVAGDPEVDARKGTVVRTKEKMALGGSVYGWPKVAELFGDDVVDKARLWLGVAKIRQEVAVDPTGEIVMDEP